MEKYSDLLLESSNISIPINSTKIIKGVKVAQTHIDKEYSLKLSKAIGEYITIFVSPKHNEQHIISVLEDSIIKLIEYYRITFKKALIVGLGNDNYIVDALGNRVINQIQVKKNTLIAITAKPVTSTGIESIDVVKAIAYNMQPDIVIAVDTLATSTRKRLCSCIQLTTAGLSPGGGLNNCTNRMTSTILDKPLIAIGVPLIITNPTALSPYNLEDYIKYFSHIISSAINNIIKI